MYLPDEVFWPVIFPEGHIHKKLRKTRVVENIFNPHGNILKKQKHLILDSRDLLLISMVSINAYTSNIEYVSCVIKKRPGA